MKNIYQWKISQYDTGNPDFCKKCGEEGSVVEIDGKCYCVKCQSNFKC